MLVEKITLDFIRRVSWQMATTSSPLVPALLAFARARLAVAAGKKVLLLIEQLQPGGHLYQLGLHPFCTSLLWLTTHCCNTTSSECWWVLVALWGSMMSRNIRICGYIFCPGHYREGHVEIRTANTIVYCVKWKETAAFYKTKLRLKITADFDWFVEFELNETARLSIADVTRTSMETCAGKGITITMEVEDINACPLFLEKAELHPPAIRDHTWGARVFYVYDPEGNRLEFWSPKKKNTAENPADRKDKK